MFNLYQIVTGAQGGQAVDNMARQFGVSREQADSVVSALMPALSTAFMTKAAHPGGLQELAGAMTDDQHKQAYADPSVAQAPSTQQKGGDVLSSIFGSNAIVQDVVNQAAKYTGVPAKTIQQMLPVILSVVIGGISTAMHNQNLGGILGQLANGLGGLFGQAGGVPGQAGTGGFGGMFGNIIGSMLGGAGTAPHAPEAPTQPQAPPPGPHPSETASTGGFGFPSAGLPPAFQAGMEALGKMFEPGVKGTSGLPNDLGAQISSILGGRKT